MSPTKTANRPPTLEEAEAALADARLGFDAARDAVVAGNPKATAASVAEARDAVEFAELRLELAQQTAGHQADQARQTRITELVDSLSSGAIAEQGQHVVALESKASAALSELYVAAVDYHEATSAAMNDLRQLGELPDHVELSGIAGFTGLRISGTPVTGASPGWIGSILRGAIYRCLHPHHARFVDDQSRQLYDQACKSLSGGIHDEKTTVGEDLAHSLARLQSDETPAPA